MKLSILREELLKPLQLVTGIVEKRQTLPILSNVLLNVQEGLSIIATDLEVELKINLPLNQPSAPGEITVPARKLVDICRSLPDHSLIDLVTEKDKLLLQSGRSRFSLTTLPAQDYPCLDQTNSVLDFNIEQKNLRFLIQRTYFAMAQQDVRYYLNGMLLEVKEGIIRGVATDGHRLALNIVEATIISNAFSQVIIPRKGVTELLRLIDDSKEEVQVSIMANHLRIAGPHFTFTSKLIDGRFPDYERVLPKGGDKVIAVPRELLKQSLTRASILSNEKLRGIQLQLRNGLLRIIANNPDREEAEEEINIDYQQADLDIGFNVKYLTDIFDTIDDETVMLTFSDSNSSILVEGDKGDGNSVFVVMPMRL
ncbi:MAG: DNA polymerase III subunit beta [Gammaproteobacteria bacterium]|nr:DNA polymerase III subunit beta [Gammaproteobacteria bacterium]